MSGIALHSSRMAGRSSSLRKWLSAHYALALFMGIFLAPTFFATIYFTFIASDRYVSETRFVVRSSGKGASEGASAYLQDIGIKTANDEAFAVQDFIRSRDAMRAIMRKLNLRKIWANTDADWISGFPPIIGDDNEEALFRHYLDQVRVEKNLETGITTVRAKAFQPDDAQAIVQMILDLSEAKVNEMNLRARQSRLSAAERDAVNAARRLAEANSALSQFREETELVDPSLTVEATVARETELLAERSRLQAELDAMLSRAPQNPAIPALRRRLAAVNQEVAAQAIQQTGSGQSISRKLAGYEQIFIERELAAKLHEAAQKQLEAARAEASRQAIFIETVAKPSRPDEPLEPQRLRYSFTVALLSFWTFLSVYLLVSGSREHLNIS